MTTFHTAYLNIILILLVFKVMFSVKHTKVRLLTKTPDSGRTGSQGLCLVSEMHIFSSRKLCEFLLYPPSVHLMYFVSPLSIG